MGNVTLSAGRVDSSALAGNAFVQRFISPEHLDARDPFWNQMLSFQMRAPKTRCAWKAFEEAAAEFLRRLAANNPKSGNLGQLVRVLCARKGSLRTATETDSSVFLWQTFNAILLIRVCLKHFVESLKEDEVIRQLAVDKGDNEENVANGSEIPEPSLDALVETLVEIITDLPLQDSTYGIHTESVHALLILLSTPLFSGKPAFQMKAYQALMTSDRSLALTRTLLLYFADQGEAPAAYLNEEGGSIVIGLASGVWNILTFGYGSSAAPESNGEANTTAKKESGDEENSTSRKPLSDASVLLLLVLTNHCTDQESLKNPFRSALFRCAGMIKEPADKEDKEAIPDGGATLEVSFRIDFSRLFSTLSSTLSSDESTLLLYLLLHQNAEFRSHVLASSDVEKVVLPILRTLYNAPTSNNHHIYMSLIVLLILSEDDLFNTSVHDVTMTKQMEWYTERALSEVSLGGILILVVIRTIQYNMLKMRDKYLHTNCLAALANMSSQFKNLHPYVSQRIVSMFEALAKKHARLVTTLQQSAGEDLEGLEEESPLGEAIADVAVLEEVLRMILEIINSCLVAQIKNNPNLIYTLLYKKDLFQPFMTSPAFQDLSQNLQTVITYFNAKLEQIQEKKERTLAVSEVQDVIKQTALQFPREKLTKFPDLKFKYVEEEQPEDFFVPYVWTLVSRRIYWNPKSIKLFEPR